MEITRESLIKRFKDRACKTLPKDCTKKEQIEVARIKKEIKDYIRKNVTPLATPHILANLSKHHENYGETMQENMLRMLENSS